MTTMTKRSRNEAAALSRRNAEQVARKAAHAKLMEQHAARRAERETAIALHKSYWSAWLRGGCKGPKPVMPK